MPRKATIQVGILLVIAGACLALLLSSLTGSDPAPALPPSPAETGGASRVEEDALVVIQVRVVENATDAAARAECESLSTSTSQWIVAGANLNTTTNATSTDASSPSSYVFLCAQQTHTSLLIDAATSIAPMVLHAIHVLTNTTDCTADHIHIYSPRPRVMICGETAESNSAVRTAAYLSQVTVTMDKRLYAGLPGWTVEDESVTVATASEPVYLAARTPSAP